MSLLTYPQAAALILSQASRLSRTPRSERVPLLDGLHRVLAIPAIADRDHPPFDRSTRDGYAVQSTALTSGGPLPVIGELRAGQPASLDPLPVGRAIAIMTGAPLPPGADAVVMLEHVVRSGDAIRLAPERNPAQTLKPGDNIVPAGAEARQGDVLVPAGTSLAPPHIAVLAATGASHVEVFTRPRVAILATGDELVELDESPLPHQIRNSNSYTVAAQVVLAGGEPYRLATARDDLASLHARLDEAQQSADLLLLSGGVSAGQYDLVEQALAARGARFHFTGVKIQPGKPAVFGELPAAEKNSAPLPFFGLPGNPVSTMVTFLLFAAPLLRALAGEDPRGPLFARATLARDESAAKVTRFLPARLTADWDRATVERIAWQGSGDLAATARSNCFVVLAPDTAYKAGDPVQVLLS